MWARIGFQDRISNRRASVEVWVFGCQDWWPKNTLCGRSGSNPNPRLDGVIGLNRLVKYEDWVNRVELWGVIGCLITVTPPVGRRSGAQDIINDGGRSVFGSEDCRYRRYRCIRSEHEMRVCRVQWFESFHLIKSTSSTTTSKYQNQNQIILSNQSKMAGVRELMVETHPPQSIASNTQKNISLTITQTAFLFSFCSSLSWSMLMM